MKRKPTVWSHLLKKSLMENVIFNAAFLLFYFSLGKNGFRNGRYWKVLEGFTVITKLITTCITAAKRHI